MKPIQAGHSLCPGVCLLLLSVLLPVTFSELLGGTDSKDVQTVCPGVLHATILRSAGPFVIHVLQIDLGSPALRIESARAYDKVIGREKLSAIASRKNDAQAPVIAALNADFFGENGETMSGQIVNGVPLKGMTPRGPQSEQPSSVRSQFGMTRGGKPVIDRFEFAGSVFWKNGSRSNIGCVNVLHEQCGIALFNSYFGPATPIDTLARGAKEALLVPAGDRNDTLLYTRAENASTGGGTPIVNEDVVLQTPALSPVLDRGTLDRGDTVKILTGVLPDYGPLRTLVGGTPRIVLDGHNVAGKVEFSEGTSPEFSTKRHPRTGIGFSKDSTMLLWITVDGRQDASVGMSLKEFADLMIELGVYEGLNLDGGGSTTMFVAGHVVNKPSDATGERPIGNCLLLREWRTH